MADKVKDLAEQLYCEEGDRWAKPEYIEREIREALKPLLDLAERAQGLCESEGFEVADELAAELAGWATQRGGNSDTTKSE